MDRGLDGSSVAPESRDWSGGWKQMWHLPGGTEEPIRCQEAPRDGLELKWSPWQESAPFQNCPQRAPLAICGDWLYQGPPTLSHPESPWFCQPGANLTQVYGIRYREMQGWQRRQHVKTNGPFRQGHTEAATQLPWWSPCISSTVGTLDQFSPVWEQSGDSGRHALSHGGIAVSGKLFALFILS